MDSGIVIISAYIYVMLTLMCIINIQKFERINPIPLELQRRYMNHDHSDGLHSSDADDEGDIPNI
jgi:hypothetical protein